MKTKERIALKIGLSIIIIGMFTQVWGEDIEQYPSQLINLTVAYPPGGSTDLISRAIAKVAEKYIKQPIVVINKPGGNGLIALQHLISSKPDGYTLHLGRPAYLSVGPFIEDFPFQVEKVLVPIAMMGTEVAAFAVWTGSPWKTIEELVAAAKAEPGKIKYATTPTATVRLMLEKFAYDAGVKFTHVPFEGSAPAAIAVAGGHVPMLLASLGEALPYYKSNKIRILVLVSNKRSNEAPEVPTLVEKGYKLGLNLWWLTVFGAKGVPEPILKKVEGLMKKMVEDKEYAEILGRLVIQPSFLGMGDFDKYWESERKICGDVLKEIGLTKK